MKTKTCPICNKPTGHPRWMYCQKCLDKGHKHLDREKQLTQKQWDVVLLQDKILRRQKEIMIDREKYGLGRWS